MPEYQLYLGDCLDILPTLEDDSVDAVLTDLPYGTTACKWDVIIPMDEMWKQVKRVLRKHGVFVTTASQPFTSVLVCSNLKWFKYEWVWDKVNKYTRYLNANIMPLSRHENIVVFSRGKTVYNKQMRTGKPYVSSDRKSSETDSYNTKITRVRTFNNGNHNPCSILEIKGDEKRFHTSLKHPTQKPVALYEYLIKTYTNEGDTVLDFCMGSGTTGVAALKLGRKFIGIEKEPKYFAIAAQRITDVLKEMEHA